MHETEAATSMLRDGVILLGFAMVFVLLFRKFGLGAVLGYLVAGALVGPHVLGLVGDAEQKLGIAELGITLLLFLVGLELSPTRLWTMRRDIFGLGLLQVTLCGIAVALLVWSFTPFTLAAALALGLPLGLSSTAQVLPMLQSAGRLRTPFGERAFSILLFQDLSIVPLITIITALSRNPADAAGPPGWMLALYTVGAVVGLVLAGRFILNPLFRLIGNLGEREMFIFAGLFTVIASAAVMETLGLSTALGAFVAGVMLAESPYRHELEADVEPFRTILLGLFFLAVGMMLDLTVIAERPFFVIGMAVALIATKAAIIMGLGAMMRMDWRQALALGLLLSQGGEFGFVLFAQAQNAYLIQPEAASLFGAIVTVSMATTPFLMALTKPMRAKAVGRNAAVELDGPARDGASAIIVGYGRFGQTVGQMLVGQGVEVTLIDTDPEIISISGDFGMKVYYGDGTRPDLLRRAGADEAQALIFCVDGEQLDTPSIEMIAQAFPNAAILMRAFDRRHMMRIAGAPVQGAVREVYESAIVLARRAMESLGIDGAEIDNTELEYRRRDAERLQAQSESGDLRSGMERMFSQRASARKLEDGCG
jgi:glutathione-regulated potassium-efflux system protein KefB